MKKRILSLLLAAAMVFTSGVMVAGVEADAATKGDTIHVASDVAMVSEGGIGIRVTDTDGYYKDIIPAKATPFVVSGPASIGDTLSILWSKANVNVHNSDDYTKAAAADQLNVIWVSEDEDGDAVMLGTGDTYTLKESDKKYIDKNIKVYFWVPGEDDDNSYETAEDVFEELSDTNNYGDLLDIEVSSGVRKYIGFISNVSVKVSFGTVKGSQFKINTINQDKKDVVNIGDVYFVTTKQAANLNITFTIGDFDRKDYASKNDIASTVAKANATNDGIVWQLVDATDSTKNSSVTAGNAEIDGVKNDANATSKGAVTPTNVYNIYANVRPALKGDAVEATNKAYKTNYKLAVVSFDPSNMVTLDMQLGEKQQLKSDTIANYTQIAKTNYYVQELKFDGNKVELPGTAGIIRQTTDGNGNVLKSEYLQGWSTTPDGKNLLASNNQRLYASKIFYAVWGEEVNEGTTAVYRLYNPATGEHLYTGDYNEYVVQGNNGWKQEGVSWHGVLLAGQNGNALQTEGQKFSRIRRLYNKVTKEHLYTEDSGNEMNHLLKNPNWVAEQVVFIGAIQGQSIYRLFNPKAANAISSHLWTTDANEMNYLRTRGWNYEGVPFFGDVQ